jgi:hypothetical protein
VKRDDDAVFELDIVSDVAQVVLAPLRTEVVELPRIEHDEHVHVRIDATGLAPRGASEEDHLVDAIPERLLHTPSERPKRPFVWLRYGFAHAIRYVSRSELSVLVRVADERVSRNARRVIRDVPSPPR